MLLEHIVGLLEGEFLLRRIGERQPAEQYRAAQNDAKSKPHHPNRSTTGVPVSATVNGRLLGE